MIFLGEDKGALAEGWRSTQVGDSVLRRKIFSSVFSAWVFIGTGPAARARDHLRIMIDIKVQSFVQWSGPPLLNSGKKLVLQ